MATVECADVRGSAYTDREADRFATRPTIWTAPAGPVPVLDQLDRKAPLRPVPPAMLARYRQRMAEAMKPFRHRPTVIACWWCGGRNGHHPHCTVRPTWRP